MQVSSCMMRPSVAIEAHFRKRRRLKLQSDGRMFNRRIKISKRNPTDHLAGKIAHRIACRIRTNQSANCVARRTGAAGLCDSMKFLSKNRTTSLQVLSSQSLEPFQRALADLKFRSSTFEPTAFSCTCPAKRGSDGIFRTISESARRLKT